MLIDETKTSIDVLNALDLHPAGSGTGSQKNALLQKLNQALWLEQRCRQDVLGVGDVLRDGLIRDGREQVQKVDT